MKTKLIVLSILISVGAMANDKYTDQMMKNIEVVYKAQSSEELQNAVNVFERIGNAEKTKWEPFYYGSFGNVMLATREKDASKKDGYLDLAKTMLDKASAINPNESEIVALEGFIHMIRVTVDAAARGQQYSMLSMQAFGKALAMNPNNPRALSLMAQMQYGTAQFFKSSTAEACETLAKSLALFDSAKSDNPLAPMWGKGMAENMKVQCK
jgi:tetratricopeptide (TPR) repeat protein